ncbi:MAG: sulfate/thiosulfate transport system permease protein [Thermoleophilaceae bacterium]|nr:sulfate/thiosulfate transport system permease protein [Thermoleophilaceae bacterium]
MTSARSRYGLRFVALGYLALLLLLPLGMVFYRTFANGLDPVITAITSPDTLHALYLTAIMVVIAVPLNTVFGVACAIVLVRQRFRGRAVLDMLINLPFAVSPIVVGLSLILVYGNKAPIGHWLQEQGIQVIFSPVSMVIATVFVSLPFVVREVVPVLREIGNEQEQAASTLGASGMQTFWRVTLPAIRWGVGYGVVLSMARALGEFGAVSVVSGKILGQTETLTLLVENRYQNFQLEAAYTASFILAILALATLLFMNLLKPKEGTS